MKIECLKKFNEFFFVYFSPVEKIVEGDGAPLYPHPPYVPCSGSPGGGTWSSTVPAPGHPGHPGYLPPGPGRDANGILVFV